MLKLALLFFIVSLIAGAFGFTGVAAGSRRIAKIIFFLALAIFAVLLVLGLLAGAVLF
ncbi:MAG: DUF1328 domain-containing protein [Rhodospirillales bacterium]